MSNITQVADELKRVEQERDYWKAQYLTLKRGIKEKLKELERHDTR